MSTTRRQFLQAAVLILMPVFIRPANATANPPVRAQLKYRNAPENGMNCTTCLEFIPGKTVQDSGRCKLIPDDDEIAPNGYCIKWNTL